MKYELTKKVAQSGDDMEGKLVIYRASNGQFMTGRKERHPNGVNFAQFAKLSESEAMKIPNEKQEKSRPYVSDGRIHIRQDEYNQTFRLWRDTWASDQWEVLNYADFGLFQKYAKLLGIEFVDHTYED